MPDTVEELFQLGYVTVLNDTIQPPFDYYSWQSFIALNWPADSSGNPRGSSLDSYKTAPRVWEHYMDPADIFNTDGAISVHLAAARAEGNKFLYMTSKSKHVLKAVGLNKNDFQEADGFPLVDKNMNFALYEIKTNTIEGNFITRHHFNSIDSIYKHAPNGITLPSSNASEAGSIEIKASWRILDPSKGDDTTRYFCRKAVIYIDSLHTTNHQPLKVNALVGLVGMHIIRNPSKFNRFLIWSSFEHVDNAPDRGHLLQEFKWSFYNLLHPEAKRNTPFNPKPGDNKRYLWSPIAPYAQYYKDSLLANCSQVVRDSAVYGPTEVVNQFWQSRLKKQGSVWANYKLIGTQWEIGGESPTDTVIAPQYMANTTMETYIQSTASCIKCHGGASVAYINPATHDTTNISTALSFMIAFGAK